MSTNTPRELFSLSVDTSQDTPQWIIKHGGQALTFDGPLTDEHAAGIAAGIDSWFEDSKVQVMVRATIVDHLEAVAQAALDAAASARAELEKLDGAPVAEKPAKRTQAQSKRKAAAQPQDETAEAADKVVPEAPEPQEPLADEPPAVDQEQAPPAGSFVPEDDF